MVNSFPCKHIFVGREHNTYADCYTLQPKYRESSLYTADKDVDVKRDIEVKLEICKLMVKILITQKQQPPVALTACDSMPSTKVSELPKKTNKESSKTIAKYYKSHIAAT